MILAEIIVQKWPFLKWPFDKKLPLPVTKPALSSEQFRKKLMLYANRYSTSNLTVKIVEIRVLANFQRPKFEIHKIEFVNGLPRVGLLYVSGRISAFTNEIKSNKSKFQKFFNLCV